MENPNPPSEREWTIQEREEFFASQDAVTGLPNGYLAGAWASNSVWDSYWDAFTIERILNHGIHVTSIIPPEQGWPIACYCPICKETTFVLSLWAIEPEEGDYWLMKDTCGNDERHTMQLAMPKIEFKPLDPLPPWPYPTMMSFTHIMPIEEAKKRWPDTLMGDDEK